MKKSFSFRLAILSFAFLSLVLVACGEDPVRPPAPTIPDVKFTLPPAIPTPLATQPLPTVILATPTPLPTPTVVVPPTPTYRPTATPEIPPPPTRPAFSPTRPEAFVKVIITWLNSQKDAAPTVENGPDAARQRLKELLVAWKSLAPDGTVESVDLDGDKQPELVTTIVDDWSHYPSSISGYGVLLVLKGSKTAWSGFTLRQADFKPVKPSPNEDFVYPKLEKVADLTGDKQIEIVFSELFCGASTCTTIVHVTTWANGKFTDLTPEVPTMPTAKLIFEQSTSDPTTSIVLSGGGFGSAGTGLQRNRTEYWRWDTASRTFKLSDTKYESSFYLYFRVLDGNAALDKANYQGAITLYSGALTDSTLKLWNTENGGGAEKAKQEKQVLIAFARFRLALAYALSEDWDKTRSTLQEALTQDGLYAGWARSFLEVFNSSKAPTATLAAREGCTAAIKYSQQNKTLIDPLNQFGSANPTFKPEDICPVFKP